MDAAGSGSYVNGLALVASAQVFVSVHRLKHLYALLYLKTTKVCTTAFSLEQNVHIEFGRLSLQHNRTSHVFHLTEVVTVYCG